MKKLFLTLVLVCVYFCACEDGGDITEETGNTLKINLAKQNVDAEFEPAEYSVAVTSPYSWEAIAKNNWITIITKTGIAGNEVLRFSVQYNNGDERKGTITLKNTDYNLVAELYVTQKPFTPIINYTKSLNFTNDGGEQTLAVNANFEYNVSSNAKWLSVQKSTDGVKVVAAKHTGTEPRTAEVTISNEQYSISEVARVQQGAFTPELLISPNALTFEAEGGTQEVAITANFEYTYTSNAGWIGCNKTPNGISVSASSNTNTESRTAMISVSSEKYGISKNISVSQGGITKESTNVISYTTSDNYIISKDFYEQYSVFGASIISHTYKNGQGLIIFDAPVTSIGAKAFYNCENLTSITIPNSVTSIGSYAFEGCKSLKSITIPNSVTSIGYGAFYNCENLTSITIPNSVTSIGSYAFEGCKSLKSITIPNSVTSIGGGAFYNCKNLTSITIPNSVTSIGSLAFYNCSSLTSVHISDISSWCNISFAHNVSNPLYYAKNLYLNGVLVTDLVIPNSVTSIRDCAFCNCENLTSITIPNSVTSIRNCAFYNCENLTSITIPNSVTSIGYGAFYNCENLTSITIPNSVTSIGSEAFYGCKGELIINCKIAVETNYYYTQDTSPVNDKDSWLYGSAFTKLTIGDSITAVGSYVFYGYKSLTSITIPNSVTKIEGYAFKGCSSLTAVHISDISSWCNISFANSVSNPLVFAKNLYLNGVLVTDLVIPNSVTSIRDDAFNGCESLTSITIPNSVTSIGDYAFNNCENLTSVTIPDKVAAIGECAFYNIDGLKIYCKPTTPPSIYYKATAAGGLYNRGSFSFSSIIYVPRSAYDLYTQYTIGDHRNGSIVQSNWCQYEKQVEPYDF